MAAFGAVDEISPAQPPVLSSSQKEAKERMADDMFTPEVFPVELPIDQRQDACDVLRRVSSQAAVEIKKLADETFHAVWSSLPSGLGLAESAVRKAWAMEHYYGIVKAVIELSQPETEQFRWDWCQRNGP